MRGQEEDEVHVTRRLTVAGQYRLRGYEHAVNAWSARMAAASGASSAVLAHLWRISGANSADKVDPLWYNESRRLRPTRPAKPGQ